MSWDGRVQHECGIAPRHVDMRRSWPPKASILIQPAPPSAFDESRTHVQAALDAKGTRPQGLDPTSHHVLSLAEVVHDEGVGLRQPCLERIWSLTSPCILKQPRGREGERCGVPAGRQRGIRGEEGVRCVGSEGRTIATRCFR